MLRRGALALWGAAALGGCAEDVPPSAPPRRDAGAWPDLGPVENGCSAERLRELAADARREGDAWVLSADNGARAVQGALLAPCATAEHVTVWRHVMTREARVEVTVDSADPMETVAWVLDRCEPVLAEPLACSSSTPTEGGGRRANLVTVAIERAGTSVYVAVGGAQRPPREGEGPRSALGRFTLRVSEQPAIATGQPCSSAGSLAECAADASCQRGEFRGALVCLADGTRNGRCRGAGEVCDVGLRCVDSYCRGPVPEGAACDPDDLHACAAGSLCIALGATVRCIADGAFAGRCRTAGSPCDEGLLCDLDPSERFARCASLLGDGDVCDVSDVHRICARGSTCVNDADTTDALVYRCQRDGGRRGTCRVADPPCEEGLACRGVPGDSSSYCLPAVLTGAACTLQRTVDACEDFGLCTPDGVGGGVCRAGPYAAAASVAGARLDACEGGASLAFAAGERHVERPVVAPFTVTFFGARYDRLWPSFQGYAVFGERAPLDTIYARFPIRGEGPLVAPLLGDLTPTATSRVCARVDAAPPRVLLSWRDFGLDGRVGARIDVTAAVSAGGEVEFQYLTLDTGVAARTSAAPLALAVGLQGDTGTLYRAARLPAGGTGLRFVPR